MSAPAPPQIPLSAFADLVGQYYHRLLSLEVDLKDRVRSGQITPRSFARRVKRLKVTHEKLCALQKLCMAESPGKPDPSDIGLPLLEQCTPEERATCERFLNEREAAASGLEVESALVYRWAQDCLSGRSGLMRSILRLSTLRRFIQTLQQKTSTLQEQSQSLNIYVEKLLKSLKQGGPRDVGRSTIEGLTKLFHELDATTSRVARLRATIKQEETRIRQLSAEIKNQEHAIQASFQAKDGTRYTFSPLKTARARVTAKTALFASTQERSWRRHRLVENFWHDVLNTPQATVPGDRITQRREEPSEP